MYEPCSVDRSPRGVQNKLHAAEDGAAATSEKKVLHPMRHEGVLRSDGGGRPCSNKWLAAAKSAMKNFVLVM